MIALGKIARSTGFKLSLLYLIIFAFVASAAISYVFFNARRILDEQIYSAIDNEVQMLTRGFERFGPVGVAKAIERRKQQPGSFLYLMVDPFGRKMAGNIEEIEPRLLEKSGVSEESYKRVEDTDAVEHQAIIRVLVFDSGFRLLVGRDVEERARLDAAVKRASQLAFLVICLFSVAGGWFVMRRVLKRVSEMTETTKTLVSDNLDGRLKVTGSGDELDRLAVNLNDMLDRISELMSGLKEVSDNIAHDLKTPLTRLRNRADEALRTATSEDELREALEANINESDNLIRVFNALLMIARLEAGNAQADMTDFDASEIARDVAELYEPLVEDAGASLEINVADNLWIHGNRELLGQAVSNLMDNALKYGVDENGVMGALAITAMQDGEFIELIVSDKGQGIPEEDRERVSERFVRLEGSRTQPGFGLGLSLVSAVAQLHEGALVLGDNNPGLKAVLRLPLRKRVEEAEHREV
ncbi:ATP-binding protein [Microvirga sp. W0021]|uniref:histidine kinase n=1 Tax=Hohaiivirga grylli TaxID=3133970 RepID=A0ABV0BJV9_9HYPH